MRLAGLVILFHPTVAVINNIKTYLPLVEKLIVFDNTEIPDTTIHNEIQALPNVILIHDDENKGIAKRLNEGAKMCIAENFAWLLTMDQDSYFEMPMLENYISCLQQPDDINLISMTGVEFEKQPAADGCNYKPAKQVITSGSMINLLLFETIGGFDEALFIDDVDTDYCYQSIIKGYRIIKFENIYLHHSLGNVSYHTSLKNFKTTSRTLHSPTRLYYMVRNFFYINKKFPEAIFLAERKRRKKDLLHRVKNNFLYGKEKFAVCKYILKGWIDYKFKINNK